MFRLFFFFYEILFRIFFKVCGVFGYIFKIQVLFVEFEIFLYEIFVRIIYIFNYKYFEFLEIVRLGIICFCWFWNVNFLKSLEFNLNNE